MTGPAGFEEVIDASRAAARIEAMPPAGVRAPPLDVQEGAFKMDADRLGA